MLGVKTAAFAAMVTLALGQANADTAAHLRVRVHTKTDGSGNSTETAATVTTAPTTTTTTTTTTTPATCPSGQESIGVVGWDQDGCVASGNVCVANVNGACPSGAHCEWLDTGVYGCADGAPEAGSWAGCSDGEQTIGVVGWTHDGCIQSDNVCVAQVSNGDCPSGASCSLLDTGVYGCVASSKKHHRRHHKNPEKAAISCPNGQESIGVVGWAVDGCVASGNVCVANTNGACPTGAHCEWLETGVFGCADGAPESESWVGCSDGEQTIGVVGWTHDGCIQSDNVCVAQVSNGDCPSGAYCSLLDTGVYGCIASSKH
ncbi:hypothetical protein PHYBOEH_010949 [Phytophthora boehmeriae]|uniref:Uncharacterized protein n=1 Tax=Phytophthora boehmeriae TaxID=109152 RepID=A0A8T1WWI8_9STRA|nr:hypothetical protein PHYBOEH_010949 [Phytophthora boehmeriae]